MKGEMLKKSPQDFSNHTPKSYCNNTLHYFITVEGFVRFILSVSFLFSDQSSVYDHSSASCKCECVQVHLWLLVKEHGSGLAQYY